MEPQTGRMLAALGLILVLATLHVLSRVFGLPSHLTDLLRAVVLALVHLLTPVASDSGCDETLTARPHWSSMAVLMPFPLSRCVLEDSIDTDGACWKVGPEASPAPSKLGRGHNFVLLAGNQNWSYTPRRSDTEVTVVIDFQPPPVALGLGLQEQLARMEDECLKKSLDNLRQLCEAA